MNVLPGKLQCTRFHIRQCGASFICLDPFSNSVEYLTKASVVKACVLSVDMPLNQTSFLYCGNYKCTKLLLSRFSWSIDSKSFSFFDFTINNAYKAMLAPRLQDASAIGRWEKTLNISLVSSWKSMIAYVNDPILNNKTKEKLFKIVTRAITVGRKFDNPKSGISPNCTICDEYEDELHCFVNCSHVKSLWIWVADILSHVCPWISNISNIELLFGFIAPQRVQYALRFLRVWKVVHAETIRTIWYARCRKLFDNEDIHLVELKSSIRFRVQTTFSIFAASKQCSPNDIKAWKLAFPNSEIKNGRIKLCIPIN